MKLELLEDLPGVGVKGSIVESISSYAEWQKVARIEGYEDYHIESLKVEYYLVKYERQNGLYTPTLYFKRRFKVIVDKCECGTKYAKGPLHSSWCAMYDATPPVQKETHEELVARVRAARKGANLVGP